MSKVSNERQVTIPVRVLHEAGLDARDEVVIRALAPGRIELERFDQSLRRIAAREPGEK
ncbi:MAG: hypothetical protein M3Z27_10710 [Actinomycetota bacterium]|nr:hypothetical protein [Actinomycetota bacterium]